MRSIIKFCKTLTLVSAAALAAGVGFALAWYGFGRIERQVYEFPALASGYTVWIARSGAHYHLAGSEPRYVLQVGYKPLHYGHVMDVPLFVFDEDVASYLKRSSLVERNDGIHFVQPSGHAIFIPRSAYINQR